MGLVQGRQIKVKKATPTFEKTLAASFLNVLDMHVIVTGGRVGHKM